MSILLDALKKSEEQRQLGQAPTIHSPGGEAAPQDEGNGQWLGLGLMGLAAVAMAWIGWQQLRQPEALAERTAVAAADQAPAVVGAEEGDSPAQRAEAAAASVGEAGETAPTTGARRPQMLSAGSSRTRVESYPSDSGSLQGVTVAPPDDFQDSERQRAEVSRSFRDFKSAGTAAAKTVPKTAPATAPRTAQRPSPPASRPAAEPRTESQQGSAAAAASEPISFWELPQGVRDALPELRITVLVYAERPEDRFILIGGQRIVEKDRLEDGVQLAEIRRNGAVFEYRNYRFLVEG